MGQLPQNLDAKFSCCIQARMKAAMESCNFLLLSGTHLEIQGEGTWCFTLMAVHWAGRLFGRIQWKNGTNTTKDFLCWVVPVGILTEKDTNMLQKNPPKHLYSKKLHLYLIQRRITYFMWKHCPLFCCQAKTHILYSDLNLPFFVIQLHTEIPLGIQLFLILTFMPNFIWSHCFHSLGKHPLNFPDLGRAWGQWAVPHLSILIS